MEPELRTYAIERRFKVLPPMLFSGVNRGIIDLAKTVPLGAGYDKHRQKIDALIGLYEGLAEERLADIAPYYGSLLVDMGRTDEAVAVLRGALEIDSSEMTLRTMLVDALRRAGRYEEAQQLVQEDFDLAQASLKAASQGGAVLKEFAAINLSASLLAFGRVSVGQGRARTLTVSNLGTSALELSRLDPPRQPFSLHADAPSDTTVAPGQSLDLELLFRPDQAGQFSGALEIHSNARGREVAEVRVSGEGVR